MSFMRFLVGLVAISTFLASLFSALRAGFGYPVELAALAGLGLLLIAFFSVRDSDGASFFVAALFFVAAAADITYMNSVAGHMSMARLGSLAVAVFGLMLASSALIMQPAAPRLSIEAKRLIAAEKKLENAKEMLNVVKGKPLRKRSAKKRRKARG